MHSLVTVWIFRLPGIRREVTFSREINPKPMMAGFRDILPASLRVAVLYLCLSGGLTARSALPEKGDVESAQDKKIDHWSFKSPQHPAVPKVKNQKWVFNPIDAFVLARLEKERIKP